MFHMKSKHDLFSKSYDFSFFWHEHLGLQHLQSVVRCKRPRAGLYDFRSLHELLTGHAWNAQKHKALGTMIHKKTYKNSPVILTSFIFVGPTFCRFL